LLHAEAQHDRPGCLARAESVARSVLARVVPGLRPGRAGCALTRTGARIATRVRSSPSTRREPYAADHLLHEAPIPKSRE
jgi:hypothetical protein